MFQLDQILNDIRDKGWTQLYDVIPRETLKEINTFIDARKKEFVPAKVGTGPNKQRDENVRGDFTFWIDPISPPPAFKTVLHRLIEVKELLNLSLFLGLKDYEGHLAYYPTGYFYKKHVDRFEGGSTRTLSFVFYLNESWTFADGGELVIFDKDKEHILLPHPGSMVCFISEDFPHEVRPAKKERRSLTGWIHTKTLT